MKMRMKMEMRIGLKIVFFIKEKFHTQSFIDDEMLCF